MYRPGTKVAADCKEDHFRELLICFQECVTSSRQTSDRNFKEIKAILTTPFLLKAAISTSR